MLNKVISSVEWLLIVPLVIILTLLAIVIFAINCPLLVLLKVLDMTNDYIIAAMKKLNNIVNKE